MTLSPSSLVTLPLLFAVTGSKGIISVILFSLIIMSYGPTGGPPNPGITMAPLITNFL